MFTSSKSTRVPTIFDSSTLPILRRTHYEVCLWNTNSSEDLIFPDEMAKRGFAVMKYAEPELPIKSASFNLITNVAPPSLPHSQCTSSGNNAESAHSPLDLSVSMKAANDETVDGNIPIDGGVIVNELYYPTVNLVQ